MIDYQKLCATFIRAKCPDSVLPYKGEWEPGKLHISDLGSCPRQVHLRIGGKKGKETPQAQLDLKEIMFWAAYNLHYLVYNALDFDERLLSYEKNPEHVWEGWGGRYDCEHSEGAKTILLDVKSTHPNIIRFAKTLPKKEWMLQLGGYYDCLDVKPDEVRVLVVDRGGSNTWMPFTVPMTAELKEDVQKERHILEDARTSEPDALPRAFKISGDAERQVEYWTQVARGNTPHGKPPTQPALMLDGDWRCGYCEYLNTTHCIPEQGQTLCARMDKQGKWHVTPGGMKHIDRITAEGIAFEEGRSESQEWM
jgi:hypothetical protein